MDKFTWVREKGGTASTKDRKGNSEVEHTSDNSTFICDRKFKDIINEFGAAKPVQETASSLKSTPQKRKQNEIGIFNGAKESQGVG